MPPRPHILYRACLLDSVGNLAEVRPFSAYGDEGAHNLALMMPNMFGIELWRGGALVETLPAAARLPAGSSATHSSPY